MKIWTPIFLFVIADRGESKNILKFLGLPEFQSHNTLRLLFLRVDYIELQRKSNIKIQVDIIMTCALRSAIVNCLFQITYFLSKIKVIKNKEFSFVLSVNLMSYKKLKLMKRISGFSDNVENTPTQRYKTLSEANICFVCFTSPRFIYYAHLRCFLYICVALDK